MSQSTMSTGSRPMRTALVQRRTAARPGIPRGPCGTSTTRPPMNPPAPMMRIGRSDDNTGSLRHRVEPRHGKWLAPAIALFDHGDGREYLPRRHGRRSLAAHRSKRSEEHTSELQSPYDLVCRLLLEKKKKINTQSLVNINH